MTEIITYEGNLTGKKYKPGIDFKFVLSVPDVGERELALMIEHDGPNIANINSMRTLADKGLAPYCACIGVRPGIMYMSDGSPRGMRMNSYDLFDREYGDFLVYELIPFIAEKYSVRFSASPDMHALSGGSSGGISAFTVAWFHPEYFHRVYISSPSFLAMGRGNEIPYLIRKYETKPLKIAFECSEKEPNDYFGAILPIDDEARAALEFSRYDFRYTFFPGEGHCSRYRNEQTAYERNEWLWRGWQDECVRAPGNSPRVDRIIPNGSSWDVCDTFPKKDAESSPIKASEHGLLVQSNDGLAWYAASVDDDCIYMITDPERSGDSKLLHATLHTVARCYPKGAIDMDVDKTDRLFVLTSIGIQCVRSFGLIDAILDLPDDSAPLALAVTDALYVRTERGVYRRTLCPECVTESESKRAYTSYYD